MHANALQTYFFLAQKEDILSIELKRSQSEIHNKSHIATMCSDMIKIIFFCFYGHTLGEKRKGINK